jgi:short-subunit dehydrogenase
MAKVALVTGASAGLGAELARLFAADGHELVIVARRLSRLEDLASELEKAGAARVHILLEDLADAGAPQRIVGELAKRRLDVEFLVNNAGFGTMGTFAELDPQREVDVVRVNVTAVVVLTRLLLPAMIARKSGRILNIGSTAGFQPGPYMAVYYASKAFVNSFTEALCVELRGTGVTATLCCPGATLTEFGRIAGNDKSRLFQLGAMQPSDVAAYAYRAMLRGKAVAIPGLRNKLGLQSLRLAPRATVRRLVAALNRSGNSHASQVQPPTGGELERSGRAPLE